MVKIVTMVKNEADIVRDWVVYHASIVGIKNLIVIDNMSTDGTFEILQALTVNTVRALDYRMKGHHMTSIARKFTNEFIIPLDIDEFMVLFENNAISCDRILNVLNKLPPHAVYKMDYVYAQCSKDYSRATVQATNGDLVDTYGNMAKSFFNTRWFKGEIDHGNHYYSTNYFKSPFVLVHYHHRNQKQLVQKTKDNILGFGYNLSDRNELESVVARSEKGNHHAKVWLEMMDNTFNFPYTSGGLIDLSPLSRRISHLTTKRGILGVVARFNESLDWMLESPFNQIQYIVYNKGSDSNFCKSNVVSVVALPNLGRCDHTFLHHIVENYGTLDPVVVMLPGSIDISFKKEKAAKIVAHAIRTGRPGFVVNEWLDVRTRFADFTLDEWACIHAANVSANSEKTLTPSALRPFGVWYDAHFGAFRAKFYGIHGIFAVSPAMVKARSQGAYASLLHELKVSSNPEVGHYLERAWGAVFGNGFDFL
jgi:hypothetical protein